MNSINPAPIIVLIPSHSPIGDVNRKQIGDLPFEFNIKIFDFLDTNSKINLNSTSKSFVVVKNFYKKQPIHKFVDDMVDFGVFFTRNALFSFNFEIKEQ